ncbi:MAG TPA: phage tail sheath family protein [Cytophagales bacterium]|nr:phage tail sheath family protein [Cytophagales bacterium]
MTQFKTPGVYVQEVSTFPPSVAEVSTAVPAFIGYTERVQNEGEDLIGQPVRITSFLEYQTIFGGAQKSTYSLAVTDANDPAGSLVNSGTGTTASRTLYHQLDMYFKNGGGACYIVSTGDYNAALSATSFTDALTSLKSEDEPTLYVFADALLLEADYYSVAGAALKDCAELGDRFSILDVPHGTSATDFRTALSVPSDQLKYGAAYTPNLVTLLSHAFDASAVAISGLTEGALPQSGTFTTSTDGITITYNGPEADGAKISITTTSDATSFSLDGNHLSILVNGGEVGASTVLSKWETWGPTNGGDSFAMAQAGGGSDKVTAGVVGASFVYDLAADAGTALSQVKTDNTAVYNAAVKMLGKQRVTLSPSALMAGVYAATDRTRGVWKAPANVALTSVLAPVTKITNAEQENLNVDATSGKSINAIRSFTGQGTVVWGARTLLGNDNEWRYISVRRLFNTVEESTQKATSFAVFEPNDATTWLKVKGMIESYLFGLYEQGAFAGSTPEAAYYVNVGLGTTMTAQDILEGRMVVEIGLAAVRPAEFIVLKFSHKLQEA